jgi:hypothetical protein
MTRELKINLRILAQQFGLTHLESASVEFDSNTDEPTLVLYGDKK